MAAVLALLLVLPSTGGAQQPASSDPEPTLAPGDLIRVEIWREKDLSGTFQVDQNGVVTLPMLGEQRVTGVPLPELRDTIIAQYRKNLRNPSINITPLRRVNVLGEVTKPGMYEIDPTVTLAGAIAMAGGVTPAGDMHKIRIIRGSQVIHEGVGAARTLDAADVHSGDQIIVMQRNWFSRNSTFIVSLLFSASSIVITLLTNR